MNPEYDRIPGLKESEMKELASLYAKVFGAPPWNEVWRCPSCDRFYGPEYSQNQTSLCCNASLVIAYPEKETTDYIRGELSRPLARKKLFYSKDGQLIAFAWGYQIPNAPTLAEEKWPQSKEVQNKVIQAIEVFYMPNSPLYYISEIGVDFPFRENTVGYQLTQELLGYGLSLRIPVVFRTNWVSPMMRIATRLKMTQIMGPKIAVFNDQIIKSSEVAGFMDMVNPDRTLFIKLP